MTTQAPNRALLTAQPYKELVRGFQWQIPETFNIGAATTGFWAKADPDRLAIIDEQEDGSIREWSFLALDRLANRFANALTAAGARVGDRIGVHLPQRVETAAAHLGALKAGLITVPLFELFGEDALNFRLRTAEARFLVTSAAGAALVDRDNLPSLTAVISVDGASDHALSWTEFVYPARDQFEALATRADDRAFIIFTSGTEGPPKGRGARPPGAARPPARGGNAAELHAPARRPLLDPGGLVVDWRPARRAHARALSRGAGDRPALCQVRPRSRL